MNRTQTITLKFPNVGQRVQTLSNIERFDDFIVPQGSRGTVINVTDDGQLAVKMDDLFEGGESWGNVLWYYNKIGVYKNGQPITPLLAFFMDMMYITADGRPQFST